MTTNKTTYYDLPQWAPTDEVSILDDFNGAFADIDTGIHEAKAVADSANTAASNAASNASTALGIVNGNQTDILALQSTQTTQANSINSLTGVVNGHTTTIGGINTKLGTTNISSIGDGTVTGALEALSEGGGTETIKVLWQNPSPNAAMAEANITLNEVIENFRFYEVIYQYDNTTPIWAISTGLLPISKAPFIDVCQGGTMTLRASSNVPSGLIISVQNAQRFLTYGNPTATLDGNRLIPFMIIGYR